MAKFIISFLLFTALLVTMWWCFRPTWVVRFSDKIDSVRFQAYTSAGLRRKINRYAAKHGLCKYKLKRG